VIVHNALGPAPANSALAARVTKSLAIASMCDSCVAVVLASLRRVVQRQQGNRTVVVFVVKAETRRRVRFRQQDYLPNAITAL
jgi:hypothetical protein